MKPPVEASPSEQLRVLFVCAADLDAPSEKQALWFARELGARGHAAMLSLRGNPATAAAEGAGSLPGVAVNWHSFVGRRPAVHAVDAVRRFRPTVIHAWSSRYPTIILTRAYARASPAPVLVHWEDNEWELMGGMSGLSLTLRMKHRLAKIAARVNPPRWHYATPWSLSWSVEHATAFDALTPALAEEVRRRTGRDCAVIYPASPPEAWDPPSAPPLALPTEFDGRNVLLFTGAIHFGRVDDIRFGLSAIAEVQRRGHDVCFAYAGRDTLDLNLAALARRCGIKDGTVLNLGNLPFEQILPLLRQATVLLEPGLPSPFNRLRLPSKLQAYLASGTPVITFGIGAGELLREGTEVMKTHGSDPTELADAIESLLDDPALRATLGENGPRAARRLFDPVRNCDALVAHYRATLKGGANDQ
jgi:glycosyltransferase involved in cell wall biosynthesis